MPEPRAIQRPQGLSIQIGNPHPERADEQRARCACPSSPRGRSSSVQCQLCTSLPNSSRSPKASAAPSGSLWSRCWSGLAPDSTGPGLPPPIAVVSRDGGGSPHRARPRTNAVAPARIEPTTSEAGNNARVKLALTTVPTGVVPREIAPRLRRCLEPSRQPTQSMCRTLPTRSSSSRNSPAPPSPVRRSGCPSTRIDPLNSNRNSVSLTSPKTHLLFLHDERHAIPSPQGAGQGAPFF